MGKMTSNKKNANFFTYFASGFLNLGGLVPLLKKGQEKDEDEVIWDDFTLDLAYENKEVVLEVCGEQVLSDENFKRIEVILSSYENEGIGTSVVSSGKVSEDSEVLFILVSEKADYCEVVFSTRENKMVYKGKVKTKNLSILNRVEGDRIFYSHKRNESRLQIRKDFYSHIPRDEQGKIHVGKLSEEDWQAN